MGVIVLNVSRVLVISVALLTLAGCTRSIESQYTPTMAKDATLSAAPAPRIGIAKMDDKRSWVSAGDEKSKSFIGQAGSWKFGLTFSGKEFTPVDVIVRTALAEEFRRSGATVTTVDNVLGANDLTKYDAAATAAKVDYMIGGDLVVFEFVNETGLVTVTSRRAVSVNLKMKRVGSPKLLIDQNYSQNDRENEGMGVMHSTNVNKLMNGALKNAVHKIVSDVATAMKVPENRVTGQIEFDGVAYKF
jgi:hypothetical protein